MFRGYMALPLLACSLNAMGQFRCDCDVIVGQCQSTIKEVPTTGVGAKFNIRANTQRCSLVE